MISARQTTPGDTPAVSALRNEAEADAAAKRGGAEFMRSRHAGGTPLDPDVEFVALIGSVPVGYASGHREHDTMVIDELFVTADARDVGVGARLLEALTAHATNARCDALASTALPGDRDTKNFFESHGLTAKRIIVGRTLTP